MDLQREYSQDCTGDISELLERIYDVFSQSISVVGDVLLTLTEPPTLSSGILSGFSRLVNDIANAQGRTSRIVESLQTYPKTDEQDAQYSVVMTVSEALTEALDDARAAIDSEDQSRLRDEGESIRNSLENLPPFPSAGPSLCIPAGSSNAQIVPQSSTAGTTPQSSAAETTPQSSTAESTPQSSAAETTPQLSTAESAPQSSAAETTPQLSTVETTPQSSTAKTTGLPSTTQCLPPRVSEVLIRKVGTLLSKVFLGYPKIKTVNRGKQRGLAASW